MDDIFCSDPRDTMLIGLKEFKILNRNRSMVYESYNTANVSDSKRHLFDALEKSDCLERAALIFLPQDQMDQCIQLLLGVGLIPDDIDTIFAMDFRRINDAYMRVIERKGISVLYSYDDRYDHMSIIKSNEILLRSRYECDGQANQDWNENNVPFYITDVLDLHELYYWRRSDRAVYVGAGNDDIDKRVRSLIRSRANKRIQKKLKYVDEWAALKIYADDNMYHAVSLLSLDNADIFIDDNAKEIVSEFDESGIQSIGLLDDNTFIFPKSGRYGDLLRSYEFKERFNNAIDHIYETILTLNRIWRHQANLNNVNINEVFTSETPFEVVKAIADAIGVSKLITAMKNGIDIYDLIDIKRDNGDLL